MAESEDSSSGASQLPKSEVTTVTVKLSIKAPRRKLTLIAITTCLNVLFWTSLITLITSLYLIASDPSDGTNVPTEIFTLTSSLATIAYIVLHTIFSLKQRIWRHQRRHPSILKKTSYVAIRVAVSLCVLWLLTSGWNMIIVARQPVCLPAAPGRPGWEAGTTCHVARLGIAMSMIALLASCALFGMLASVRRPFEAHILKHGYKKPIPNHPSPNDSRRPSPSRSISLNFEKHYGRRSASTHRSSPSYRSNADVETLDLDRSSPPSTIHAPSPVRSLGLGMGIFTSHDHPPPLPAAFGPRRSSSYDTLPPVFYPSVSHARLQPPPRMTSLVAPTGFVPLSAPVQYSASVMRAVHPPLPSPLRSTASRSHSHLPATNQGPNLNYRARYSRSSISLTRPHRLSSAPAGSVGWSSRSGSTGPGDEGRRTPSSSNADGHDRPSASMIAYAILNGTSIPGYGYPQEQKSHHHQRHSSAPDTTAGAECGRMAMGWKPKLKSSNEGTDSTPILIPRASSAELLSKFSPDTSPEDNNINLRRAFERDLDHRLSMVVKKTRKSRSSSPLRHSEIPDGATTVSRASSSTLRDPFGSGASKNGMWISPQSTGQSSRRLTFDGGDSSSNTRGTMSISPQSTGGSTRRLTSTFDDVKNKPLPKIAAL